MALSLFVVSFVLSIGAAVVGAHAAWHQRIGAALAWGAIVLVAGTVGAHAGAALAAQDAQTVQDAQALHLSGNLDGAGPAAIERLIGAYRVARLAAADNGHFPTSSKLVLILSRSPRSSVGLPLTDRTAAELQRDELSVNVNSTRIVLETRGTDGSLYALTGPPDGSSTLRRLGG